MKIAIVPSARDDLARGFDFYEAQGEGLGGYFWSLSLSTSTPLYCLPESTEKSLVSTGRYPSTSPMPSTTQWNLRLRLLAAYLIVAATRRGSVND